MFSTRIRADWTLPTYREVSCLVLRSGSRGTHLQKLRHLSSLLFCLRAVFLLHHAKSRYGQLELHFKLALSHVSCLEEHCSYPSKHIRLVKPVVA